MLIATEYEILRGLKADGKIKIPLQREPQRVATLINEEEFAKDGALIHNRTVFFEDRNHDWTWKDGFLTYFTRVAVQSDVVIVYQCKNA